MPRTISNLLSKIWLSGLLSLCACSTLKPPDIPVCTELTISKGYCVKTISDEEFEITDESPYTFDKKEAPQTWWDLRPTFVLVPAPSYAELKAFVIKACKATNQCDDAVKSWDRKLETLDLEIAKKQQSEVDEGQTAVDSVKWIQKRLKKLKLYDGEIDGMQGPKTTEAIKKYQKKKGFAVTGAADEKFMEALNKEKL